MNILLTNDDGIDSEGILILAEALRSKSKHDIYILAPERNQSGVSSCLTILNNPVSLKEKSKGSWACSGLPVDCVITAALGGRPCKPDLVISGINRGANLGSDIAYSGTTAAARQAAFLGIPAIALSLGNPHYRADKYYWDMAANYSADHLDEFTAMWKKDIFVNVNIPNNPDGPGGMAITWPACKDYHDSVKFIENGPGGKDWCYLAWGNETAENQPGSDWDAVSNNMVSVSYVFIHPVVRGDLYPDVPVYAAVKRGG